MITSWHKFYSEYPLTKLADQLRSTFEGISHELLIVFFRYKHEPLGGFVCCQEYWLYLLLFHGITNSGASSLEGPGAPAHPLFWVKKEEMIEGTKTPPLPSPLLLKVWICHRHSSAIKVSSINLRQSGPPKAFNRNPD